MLRLSAIAAFAALCPGLGRDGGAFATDGVECEMSSRKDRTVFAGAEAEKALCPACASVSR